MNGQKFFSCLTIFAAFTSGAIAYGAGKLDTSTRPLLSVADVLPTLGADTASRMARDVVPLPDSPIVIDASETVVYGNVGPVKARLAPSIARVWTCGEPRDIGGGQTVRACEWIGR